jgi:lipoate-protein ligase A
MPPWIFAAPEEHTGGYNMWYDEMLVQRLMEGSGAPTVRLYRWKPWAISLGRHQSLSDIDVDRCGKEGIDVVRRPTGGRAILHAEELTYSVVMRAEGKSVARVYQDIGLALVEGLRGYGVDVSLERSQPNFSEVYRSPSSVPCFSSSARHEIVWDGRKVVGSAQRRYLNGSGEVVLQHGSILCGKAHQCLAAYLALPDETKRSLISENLMGKTADLEEISGEVVDLDRLSSCMREGFERAWGITFRENSSFVGETKGAYA